MKERIQKILSACGVCSRRKAEEWIAAGRIQCNGIVCGLGDTADPDTDSLLLDGKPLPAPARNVYILLNKPRGYVTTLSDEKGGRTVADLVADHPFRRNGPKIRCRFGDGLRRTGLSRGAAGHGF